MNISSNMNPPVSCRLKENLFTLLTVIPGESLSVPIELHLDSQTG